MGPTELAGLIRAGESQQVEFKTSLAEQVDGLQSLCGMVNSDVARGAILFGVKRDGTVCGVEPGDLDRAQQSMMQVTAAKFEPRLVVTTEVQELDARRVLVLTASRFTGIAYHEFDGRAFIREGTTTRRLTLVEKNALARARNRDLHPGPWKCSQCNSWVGLLGSVKVTEHGVERSYRCGCGGEFWPAT
jgi:predicted HTH transcriptional regulator